MRMNFIAYITIAAMLFATAGCKDDSLPQPVAQIAVSNSYLRAAVEDICGADTPILEIVPPGMCPGHFDISPSKVNQLAECKLLLVFDFQNNLGHAMGRLADSGLKICPVESREGLCIPENYIHVVRNISEILSSVYPENTEYYSRRLEHITQRVNNLSSQVQQMMHTHGLNGQNVLTSKHQGIFVQWLGFNVVSTFTGRDNETAASINDTLLKANSTPISFVIANKQEGTAMAEAIGGRLGTPLRLVSNFPEGKMGFDHLVMQNVNNLIEPVRDE